MIALAIAINLFVLSCDVNVTTAKIGDIKMCSELVTSLCDTNIRIFSQDESNIFVSCKLNNAPSNTEVNFIWKYIQNGNTKIIDRVDFNSSNFGNNIDLHSYLNKPYNGWPVGTYEVEIIIDDNTSSSIIEKFIIQ